MIAKFRAKFFHGSSLTSAAEDFFERVAEKAFVGEVRRGQQPRGDRHAGHPQAAGDLNGVVEVVGEHRHLAARHHPVARRGPARLADRLQLRGTYEPYANGYFEFTGEFEINAFGGLKFNRHQVVSRSMADFAIGGTPEHKVARGPDVIVPIPEMPADQLEWLHKHPMK